MFRDSPHTGKHNTPHTGKHNTKTSSDRSELVQTKASSPMATHMPILNAAYILYQYYNLLV